MRMWMINPKWLCRKHLLGEYGEIHKHRHNFVKHHSIAKRVSPVVQVEPLAMYARHDALAAEMVRRGYNHNSLYEMPDLSYLPKAHREVKVDVYLSIKDLIDRCPECKKRFEMLESGRIDDLLVLR